MNVSDIKNRLRTLMRQRGTDPDIQAKILSMDQLRPLRVMVHIIEHGSVSTEELTDKYGYNQPPRAAQDVRDHGIPLDTRTGRTKDGRRMAIYVLGDPAEVLADRRGRQLFSKDFREALINQLGSRCTVCHANLTARYLQIDHRIPFQIGGEVPPEARDATAFMLVCASCNRSKSWECEHCPNWDRRDASVCRTCYWATPEGYDHVATLPTRRSVLVWDQAEVGAYDSLKKLADEQGVTVSELIKRSLASPKRG